MFKLLPITAVSVLLAWISHSRSKSSAGSLTYDIKRERFYWTVMAVIIVLFAGLRTMWNDTYHYVHAYEVMDPNVGLTQGLSFLKIGTNPGFVFANRVLRRIGVSSQGFLMVYAAVTIGIYMWFIRKYTNNGMQSVFLFFTMGSFVFCMAAIKQCIAVAFCLVAIDRWINNKKFFFFLWIVIAMLFHPYAFLYLSVPLLFFTPWTTRTWYMLLAFGLIGILLQPLMAILIGVTSMIGEEYTADLLSGEGINIFRVLVVSMPVLLSFLVKREIAEKDDPILNLVVNLSMLNAEIMFVGLFGTANYFGRLANYFLLFQALALPKLITLFKRSERRVLTYGMVGGYILYYIYAYSINVHFDKYFENTTLIEYLKTIFVRG